ncbi:MAG: hypothetical protein E7461_04470 [Ruminococcaceae bacterium]|nr:hypothetical protein [Oscillospiraceae bacterium]
MKRFLSAFLVLLLLFGGARPVSATPPTISEYEGLRQAGIIPVDKECPIEVEHMLLTFDLQSFANPHKSSKEELSAYNGKVTAEYALYNPTDSAITTSLLYPLCIDPQNEDISYLNAHKYGIWVDSNPIEADIRHTLYSDTANPINNPPILSDTYLQDPFYTPNLTVTIYHFSVENVDYERYMHATAAFDLPQGLGDQRFYISNQRGVKLLENGDMRVITYAPTLILYVFGTPLETMPTFTFYKDGNVENNDHISGKASLSSTETMTFEEYALRNWRAQSGISEIDWYNATVTDLNQNTQSAHPVVDCINHYSNFPDGFISWYEYEVTIQPGQQIVNTVTAPIYPSIDLTYNPDIYGYNYLLSPATTWKSFGKLDVVINTPYYLLDSMPQSFEKTDTGYKLPLDTLPEDELMFQLCETDNPEKTDSSFNWAWIILLAAPFLMLIEAFEAIGEFFTNLFQNLF